MKKIQGTHIHLGSVDTDGTFSAFAFARQASVSMKRKMIQIASPTTGDSEEYIPGRKSWQMDCGCLLSSDASAVHTAYNQGKKLHVQFRDETPDWSDELKYAYNGYAYIDALKSQGNIHSMASFNISLQGTGTLNYEQWTEDFTIKITGTLIVLPTLNEFRITTEAPLPCDIILRYTDPDGTTHDTPFKKGDTINHKLVVSKTGYNFSNWSVRQAVANYNINLVEGTRKEVSPTA